MISHEEAKIQHWIKKIKDLVDVHDLSIYVYEGTKSIWINSNSLRSHGIILCSSARADHIQQLKALGVVTGWFSMEQRESVYTTLWEYELVII